MNGFEYYRRKANLTQLEVAGWMGIDQTTVSRWEKGRKLPRSGKLPVLSQLYHCTIEDLFREFDESGQ
jgi:transcriptional regulator with XRE-family HTH domain